MAEQTETMENSAATVSTVLSGVKVGLKWLDFGIKLKDYTEQQKVFMNCFLTVTLDRISALEAWRDDTYRYNQKAQPVTEALDLLIAQIMQTAYQGIKDYEAGTSPAEIAKKLSNKSFWDAMTDTINFAGSVLMKKISIPKIKPAGQGLIPAGLMNAKAVCGIGAFVLSLMDSASGYSEWRDTVKQLYTIKQSLSESVMMQLEAYRKDPGYEQAVIVIESLKLLRFLKLAGEKTMILDFLSNAFPKLSPASLSVMLNEILKDDNNTLTYPQAGFTQIDVVEYRDTHAVANSKPTHSDIRIMGYYSETPYRFMGKDLTPLLAIYKAYCMETDDPSPMEKIGAIDSSWTEAGGVPDLDFRFIQKNHAMINRYMPKGKDYIYNPKTGQAIEIETYNYDESLFEGDSGYFYELVHGTVYAYDNEDAAITLTPGEYSQYTAAEKEARDQLQAYQGTISHSDKEAKEHQMEERWIWANVTAAYIDSVEMFEEWLEHER